MTRTLAYSEIIPVFEGDTEIMLVLQRLFVRYNGFVNPYYAGFKEQRSAAGHIFIICATAVSFLRRFKS